ncbi:MAG: hypothetical protein EA380_11290 [Phycisphaeraceae bacterium]|nr:MAG: hypothetical protein EA380_11290 [Phycisphaeraceae bacterium]
MRGHPAAEVAILWLQCWRWFRWCCQSSFPISSSVRRNRAAGRSARDGSRPSRAFASSRSSATRRRTARRGPRRWQER